MKPPRVRTVVLAWAFIVATLLCFGVDIGAQRIKPPEGLFDRGGTSIRTNIPEVLRGIPAFPGQSTSRAVEDCGLTKTESLTKVCFSYWTVEPIANAGVQTWVNCNGTARQTNGGGVWTIKATKGTLYKCTYDTPEGYNLRPFGAPGAQFQEAIHRFMAGDGHILVITEMLKR